MLTLILLVVLGGGVGLLAVWLIEPRGLSRLLGRLAPRSLRRSMSAATAPVADATGPALAPAGPVQTALHPVEPSVEPLPAAPPAGAARGSDVVPKAYTAVEGTYREVARAPLWRKLLSLVLLVAILTVIGLAIAALTGAAFGLVAELVDSAVE